MDTRLFLLHRIDSLLRELGQAEAVLERLPPDPVYGVYLQDHKSLLQEIQKQRKKLLDARAEVEDNKPLRTGWTTLSTVRGDCVPLFAECLACALGPLVRDHDLDAGLCRVADVLLERLSIRMGDVVWRRHTTLAEAEFIDRLAQVVRLRFPVTCVWDLPIAAHEFGHFVGLGLERRGPLRALMDQSIARDGSDRFEGWLREHFADTFGTYVLGPAFACTLLLTLLNPAKAPDAAPYSSHPSDTSRAYAILSVLERMDKSKGIGREFSGVIDYLKDAWQGCATDAGLATIKVAGTDAARLGQWLDVLYPLIEENYPDAKYQGWSSAKGLAAKLRIQKDPAVAGLTPGDGDKIADVLNAAWLCRLEPDKYGLGVADLGDRALSWCRYLADPSVRRP
jgi:hypothetical protein